jgi:iron complex outermembrane receptor protein
VTVFERSMFDSPRRPGARASGRRRPPRRRHGRGRGSKPAAVRRRVEGRDPAGALRLKAQLLPDDADGGDASEGAGVIQRSFSSLALRLALLAFATPASSAGAQVIQAPAELKKMSLEELFDIEVTSVSKKLERLFDAAAAIQVITQEDIRRSGASTLPEALRLAPNLHVAQSNSHDWAISARGFNGAPTSNGSLTNKMLVLIDGRSVYTPLFGGVFWDVQHVLLEDVDRIEVVSGPGGTLWGSNAVNGVVNVITKRARDTQGAYASGSVGSLLQDSAALRYGGSVGSKAFYRVHAQRLDFGSTELADGSGANDAWDLTQGGFRVDWQPSDADMLTLQGDFYGGSEGSPTTADMDGQNALARWTHAFSEESEMGVQAYFDRTWRKLPSSSFGEELQTYDLDLQHRFPLGGRQSIVWGAGYRLLRDDVDNSVSASFLPAHQDMHLFSAFVQDEIALVPERLELTLGTKLEHNEFSGLELQPSARLAWMPTGEQTVWAAVSRAVHSPTRFDAEIVTPVLAGDEDFDSEQAIAYELGYRVRPVDRLSLSFAGFFNRYDDLRSFDLNASAPPMFVFGNGQKADTWGFEVAGTLQAMEWWRLRGGYTYLAKDIWATSAAVVAGSDDIEGLDPSHQFLLHSMMDLPRHVQFDLVGRYVDTLSTTTIAAVPRYFTFDARLAWQFKGWEFAAVGQNLWDDGHSEFGAQIPRSVYGKVTWRY